LLDGNLGPNVRDDQAMSMDAAARASFSSPLEQLRLARSVLRAEGQTLLALAERVGGELCRAVELVLCCRGSVIVTGMGKAGLVGQKIAATLASTGTRSHFLHPAEALHGDLGRIHADDVALVLSQSGETDEIVRLLPSLSGLGLPIIAITGRPQSELGRAADVTLDLGDLTEACPLGLAPSTSTTAMLGLGDAVALVAARMRGFGPADFARLHPGGSLGRKLAKVEEVMRPLAECRVADGNRSVREVFIDAARPGRRTGAIMLTGADGRLTGVFTDSDLARLLESHRTADLDRAAREIMTTRPTSVPVGTTLADCVEILVRRKFSELPVVDADGRPVGLLDITDVVSLLPRELPEAAEPETPARPSTKTAKSSPPARLAAPRTSRPRPGEPPSGRVA
jgi:arabinose-5-phosphate isomerase